MLSQAIKAAKKAGEFLKTSFTTEHTLSYKDALNIVTEADTASEKIILGVLQTAFPDHSFFSEEAGLIDNNSEYLWIIDPLDGTTNFTRLFPRFAVSIGLAYQGKPLLGVVYDPLADELFSASQQKGAFLNEKPLRVNDCQTVNQSVLLLGRGSNDIQKKHSIAIYSLLSPQARTARILGSVALDICQVASGQFDALVFAGCSFYDAAAGIVIAKEAGARVSDFTGKDWDLSQERSDLVISNPQLHARLLASLASLL